MKNYMQVLDEYVIETQMVRMSGYNYHVKKIEEITTSPGFELVAERYDCKTKEQRRELANWMVKEKLCNRESYNWYI